LNFVNEGVITLPDFLALFKLKYQLASPELKPGVQLSTKRLSDVSGQPIAEVTQALSVLVNK
jgi:hypothetical protein